MAQSQWQRRMARAEELGAELRFATEILRFYGIVAKFQEGLYSALAKAGARRRIEANEPWGPLPQNIARSFAEFLNVIEENGPDTLREAAHALRDRGASAHFTMLTAFWDGNDNALSTGSNDFFARAFLQPYAVTLREGMNLQLSGATPFLCPFCKRKPVVGVLRPLGDGGQRSLVCSFCLGEWEFRRIVCPGCGEEDHAKLPVYVSEELKHVRVEACDRCRAYIKTVDMTKTGLAEPIVDEVASIPLDLWARKQGYAKLQPNLLQL